MSNHVSSEVYKRQLGSLTRKAVMALLADKASDNGTGIWASKQTMADELDTSKQTMITTIKSLVADGLLIEVGHRRCQNGYLVEYAIVVHALRQLPHVKAHHADQSSSLTSQAALPVKQIYPTSQAALPDRSSSLTQTSLEPSLNHTPPTPRRGEERAGSLSQIPDDWKVPDRLALPAAIAALAAQWPDGAYQAEAAAFHQHWRGTGRRKADWTAFWAARVQARHSAVLRDTKAGVSFAGSAANDTAAAQPALPVAAKRREDDRSNELHHMLEEALGKATWECWFARVALLFEDCGLIVVSPSSFHRSHLESNYHRAIDQALSATGRGVDWTRFIVEQSAAAPSAKSIAAKPAKSGGKRRA